MFRRFAERLFGPLPPPGAPTSERLRFVRRFYLRPAPLSLAAVVLAFAVTSGTLSHVILAVAVLAWMQGVVSLASRIRKAEAAGD